MFCFYTLWADTYLYIRMIWSPVEYIYRMSFWLIYLILREAEEKAAAEKERMEREQAEQVKQEEEK